MASEKLPAESAPRAAWRIRHAKLFALGEMLGGAGTFIAGAAHGNAIAMAAGLLLFGDGFTRLLSSVSLGNAESFGLVGAVLVNTDFADRRQKRKNGTAVAAR